MKLVSPDEEKSEATEKRKKLLEQPEEYSPQSQTAKRVLLTLAVIGGIAIIAWAGYNLYRKKTTPINNSPNSEVALKEDTETVQKIDTSKNTNIQPDSAAAKKDNIVEAAKSATDTSFYKFVILITSNKHRAFRRYNQLDSIEHKVKISTKDSSLFKVYFLIHTSPKDTLRIKDSLNSFYATKTTIEQ